MFESEAPSFLHQLLAKRAMVLKMSDQSGKSLSVALKEVDRQIAQCLKHGDVVGGQGVTKSHEEQ